MGTTGGATQIIASIKDGVGANGIVADNSDVALVQVEVQDEDGNVVPANGPDVTFTVSGPGKLIGTGNGDPASHTNDKAATRETYHGLVLGVLQGTHTAGKITVKATSPSLGSSRIEIDSTKPTQPSNR